MKYIKTRNGIFLEEIEWTTNPPKKLAIKRSNSIVKLCDFIVFKYKKEEKPIIQDLTEFIKCLKEIIDTSLEKHCVWMHKTYKNELEYIKLGVWTDEGVKFVANINEKGRAELI